MLLSVNLIGRRYQLDEVVGQGGMGQVFRATDRLTGDTVALKRVISPTDNLDFSNTLEEGNFRLSLAQEFKLLASLRHPNIIEVLDYGFDDEQLPYFTMELLQNAQDILTASQGQTFSTQLDYIVQTLQALAYLHRRGILHRDLKPANVLVTNGKVKVLDFGLSAMKDHEKHNEEEPSPTTAGTLAYMAPEVLVGNPANEAADLYAVGMMMYEMISGSHPFSRHDIGQLVNQILFTMPDLSSLDITLEVAGIIQRLLHKQPNERYASAYQVIQALDEVTDEPLLRETQDTRESFLQAARLVGRDTERRKLSDAMQSAIRNKGSAWLIGGESGVGKSRLVDEIRTMGMVNGMLVMRGQAVSEGRSPFQLWRPVLRWLSLLADLPPLNAGIIKLLVPDIVTLPDYDLEAASELDPQNLLSNLINMLQSTLKSITQPVLIILEDLHWANSESISLLSQLTSNIDTLPLMVVTTYRDDESPDLPTMLPSIQQMKLGRLGPSQIAELSRAMLGDAGGQGQVVNLLQKETEGNVFFLIEVVRALAEEAGELDEIGRMTLPEHVFAGGIDKIIQRRLTRLSDEAYELLKIAAVIGRQQNLSLLQAVAPDKNISQWLIECNNAAVLDVLDGEWRFAHDKLRDGVLDTLAEDEMQQIHGQVAKAIETLYEVDDYAATLAHHWKMAGNAAKEDYYVSKAGEQSLHSGAYEEAIAFFERALTLIHAEIVTEAQSQQRRIYLQHRKAEAYLGFGGYKQAEELYQESLIIAARMKDQKNIAQSLNALGEVHYATGLNEKARQNFQESLAIYREIDDKAGIAKVLNSLGNIAYDQGDHNIAKKLYQQSMNMSRELGDQWGMAGSLTSKEIIDTDLSEYVEAKQKATQTLEISMVDQNKQGMANALMELGVIAYDIGDYEDAAFNFNRALTILTELEDMPGIVLAYNRLGAVSQAQEEYEQGEQHLRKALRTAVKTGQDSLQLRSIFNLAKLYAAGKKPESALEILSFVLSYKETPEQMQDEAERLVFDLEQEVEPTVLEYYWEHGKNRDLATIIKNILAF